MSLPNDMTPDRVRELIEQTGDTLMTLARVLGFKGHSSVKDIITGRSALHERRAAQLEAYAELRARQLQPVAKLLDQIARLEAKHKQEIEAWLVQHPPPTDVDGRTDGKRWRK